MATQNRWPVVLNPGSTQERTAQAGDIPLDGDGDALVALSSGAGAPTADYDSIDTAGVGRTFVVGSEWLDTDTGTVYKCTDASVGAAVWVAQTGGSSTPTVTVVEEATAPTVDNDDADTAGLGTEFKAGDVWVDTTTGAVYTCADATTGAAEWPMMAPRITGLWEDLRFPAQGINPRGALVDPDRDDNTGLLLFDDGRDEIIAGVAQIPHSWVMGSVIEPHIHWYAAGSAPGENRGVVWRFEWEWVNNGDPITGTYSSEEITASVAAFVGGDPIAQINNITAAGIDGTGKGDSSLLLWRLTRVGTDGDDTYVGDVALIEFDIHYRVADFGSFAEFGD
jgi:hypothetical protein